MSNQNRRHDSAETRAQYLADEAGHLAAIIVWLARLSITPTPTKGTSK